jgi:hypothetical protein
MELIRIPVEVHSQDGYGGGTGEVVIFEPPLRRRLWKAGALLLVGVTIGTLLLPVPLIHLAGVMFFLAMSWLAVRRLFSLRVLKGAHGRCPSCHQDGDYFVGFGGRRLAYPVNTSCPHCRVQLELAVLPPAADAAAGG